MAWDLPPQITTDPRGPILQAGGPSYTHPPRPYPPSCCSAVFSDKSGCWMRRPVNCLARPWKTWHELPETHIFSHLKIMGAWKMTSPFLRGPAHFQGELFVLGSAEVKFTLQSSAISWLVRTTKPPCCDPLLQKRRAQLPSFPIISHPSWAN